MTSANIAAATSADATINLTQDAGQVFVSGLQSVVTTITANASQVGVVSGGDATVNTQTPATPASVIVAVMGTLQGNMAATGNLNLRAGRHREHHGRDDEPAEYVPGRVGRRPARHVYRRFVVERRRAGAVNGSFTAQTGSASVVGKGSVAGTITSNKSNADVASGGAVNAAVAAPLGGAIVSAGSVVTGTVTAGGDAKVAALAGAFTGTVNAGHNADVTAGAGIFGTITAAQDANVLDFGTLLGAVTATQGTANVNDFGTLLGTVNAGGEADVYADQLTGSVNSGYVAAGATNPNPGVLYDANVTTTGTLNATITATGAVLVDSAADIQGSITAATNAKVFAAGNMGASIDVTAGDAVVDSGGAVGQTISASHDVNVDVLGTLGGEVDAGHDATVVVWGDATKKIDAANNATVDVNGSLSGDVEATLGNATVNVAGERIQPHPSRSQRRRQHGRHAKRRRRCRP